MGKFATNKNGNIDSGTEVLANNMTFLQQTKEENISDLFGDLFDEGILNGFKLTANADGTFNVGIGIGYKKDIVSSMYKRIAILEETEYHNELFGDSTYPDGRGINQKTNNGVNGEYVDTPKSTGCLNIPISANETLYYIDIRYLNVCDNNNDGTGLGLTNYSIAKNVNPSDINQRKRFYKWIDGYEIVLVPNIANVQGICLGTVQKDLSNNITFTDTNKTNEILIKSKIIMDYFTEGSGITITEQSGKKKLAVNVDNKTTEIENNQVRVTKDGLYPYTKFAMNSGPENILGTNLTEVFLFLPTNTELWLSPAYNDRYSINNDTAIDSIDVWALAQTQFSGQADTYTICINNTDKANNNAALETPKLELMNKIRVGKINDISEFNQYDILIDLTEQPFQAKWFDGSQWKIYHGVPLGEVNVSSGTINSLNKFAYNTNFVESTITTSTTYIDHQSAYNVVFPCVDINISPTTDSTKYPQALNMKDKSNNLLGSLEYGTVQIDNFYGLGLVAKKRGEETYDAQLYVGYKDSKPRLTFNYNPIPRLPDYSTFAQLYGSSSDQQTKTIQNDGWLHIRPLASTSYVSVNGGKVIDNDWGDMSGKIFIFPIKAGDSIGFRYTVISFYSYR